LRRKKAHGFNDSLHWKKGPGANYSHPWASLQFNKVSRPLKVAASGLQRTEMDAILNELAQVIVPVTTHYQWRPQLRDASDEMVLEAAVNAQANAIVTYNLRDFKPAQHFGVLLLNPEQTFNQFSLPRRLVP